MPSCIYARLLREFCVELCGSQDKRIAFQLQHIDSFACSCIILVFRQLYQSPRDAGITVIIDIKAAQLSGFPHCVHFFLQRQIANGEAYFLCFFEYSI